MHEDQSLVAAALGGDEQAKASLVKKYWSALYAFVKRKHHRIVASREGVSDICQSTLGAAFADLGRFTFRGEQSLWRWLQKRASNKLSAKLKYHLALKRDPNRELRTADSETAAALELEAVAEIPSPSAVASAKEQGKLISLALEQLPARDRHILEDVCFNGWTIRDLATDGRYGDDESTVRKELSRARIKLLKKISRQE